MNKPIEHGVREDRDGIQDRLATYASELDFNAIPAEVVHAAKVRIIDTLGALMGGFHGEPCRISRNLAARCPSDSGATVIGTRIKATPEMAAFANATTARYVEMNDVYHWPGSMGGHPSDVLTPILAVAETSGSSGRDLITAVVLGYEIYLRISDAVKNPAFDCVNFACLGTAAAGARLMGLHLQSISDALSMAAVSGNVLSQVRNGHLSMWKAVAAGQAARTGINCAVMATEGMQGPHLPFVGKHGWCNHVSGPLELARMGGEGASFKICDTLIKQRSSCATTISSILAAENASEPVRARLDQVKAVTVEVYDTAKRNLGTEPHHWDPRSRETADHSIPYVVAATLIDGTITPLQFNEAHLWSPQLRSLLPKIQVVENPEFTRTYHRVPVEHPARVTVEMADGQRVVGESGGSKGDLSNPKSDTEIEAKFRGMAEDFIGKKRCDLMLEQLWTLEKLDNVARIPPAMVFA